jgi:hypothetical protein
MYRGSAPFAGPPPGKSKLPAEAYVVYRRAGRATEEGRQVYEYKAG